MASLTEFKPTISSDEDDDSSIMEINPSEFNGFNNESKETDMEINEFDVNNSNSNEPHVEEKQFIPIEEQRQIINKLVQESNITEGNALYIIYEKWWNSFFHEVIETPLDFKTKIGSINTTKIIDQNGIFCDPNAFPLKAITYDVFSQLQEWYGMTPNSRIVQTFAVEENGIITPEYSKPHFFLHYLSADSSSTANHSYNHNSHHYLQIPSFTISKLFKLHFLVQQCITTLDGKEHLSKYDPDFSHEKFRIWIIQDENMLDVPYKISPAQFMRISSKLLIKKEHLEYTLRDSRIPSGHLLIERYVSRKLSKQSKGFWPSHYYIHHPPIPSDGRIGLTNLGNTCYMNSALQCLVHIPELTQYFLFDCLQDELNYDNPLGNGGKVAIAFSNLIHNLFDKKSDRGTSYTPRDFKQTIGHFNQMFSGYHQQDSQEFLAFLLDGLHEDLNRIIKKPFVEKPELDEKDANNQTAIRELAQKSWDQHKLRNDSIIIDLFVGLYKSTLICPSCDKISITFDPFNDLTLPLPVKNEWTGKVLLFLEEGPIKSFEVELPKTSTYSTLKKYIASKLNLNPDNFVTAEIWNKQFYRNFESAESQSGYLPISDLISDNDIIVMYEVKRQKDSLVVPVLNTVLPDSSNIPIAFGIPFFITLSPEEANSFGTIRRKLEHRYEQLSTFKYFSKTREAQGKEKFTSQDFEMLADGDYDAKSDISLANPEISGEYAFKVKKIDGTREFKPRKKLYNTRKAGPDSDDSSIVWTPNTANNFKNLPDLLDEVDPKKAKFYRQNSGDFSKENKIELPSTKTSSDSEVIDITDDPDADEELNDKTGDIVADLNTVESNSDMNIETFFTPKSEIADLELIPDDSVDTASDSKKKLLEYKNGLVCEWSPEEFDIFFSDLEEEGKGGNNTWSNPEVLVNEEVEESRRKKAEEANNNLTLDQCLKLFSKAEVLGEHDLWYCSHCKEHRQASKQIQIWSTPDILSIHLKRFENQRSFSDKIDAVVEFPIEGLDMSSYLADEVIDKDSYIYDLFAVDNHYGGLGGGHYTSYVKNFIDNKWYYYDDSRVTPTTPEKSITGAAYLLFYRRRSSKILGGDEFVKMVQTAREGYENNEKQELENLELFYRQNKDETSEEESEEDEHEAEDEDEEDDAEDEELEDVGTDDKENKVPAPLKIKTSDSYSLSISVGPSDDEDDSSPRRKQRLLGREKRGPRRIVPEVVDIESSVPASPDSSPDGGLSSYSTSVTDPIASTANDST